MAKRFPSKLELMNEMPESVVCKVAACSKSFKHPSALRFHMVKVHNIIKTNSDLHLAKREKMTSIECQYHCPEEGCKYYFQNSSSKCFASMKLLRQHYKQVHCVRRFECTCGSKFSRKFDLKRHQTRENVETCYSGVTDKNGCSNFKMSMKRKSIDDDVQKGLSRINEPRLILPKTLGMYMTPIISDSLWNLSNSVVNISNFQSDTKLTYSRQEENKKSSTTQTNEGLMFKTTSTQTSDDPLLLIKANKISQGSQVLWSRKNQLKEHENSHTQTNILTEDAFSTYGISLPQISNYQMFIKMNDCQTQTLQDFCDLQTSPYIISDDGYSLNRDSIVSPSLQDQFPQQHSNTNHISNPIQFITDNYPLKNLSSISQQTTYNELLQDVSCSAETQTSDLMCYGENSQYSSLNNIETQTVDMFDLDSEFKFINELEYTDIETQTSYQWVDYLNNKNLHGKFSGLFSDTETQTHYDNF